MKHSSTLQIVLAMMMLCAPAALAQSHWEWSGWGGGGFCWAAAYHPIRPGVIYLGGDCAGMYKTDDDGQHWRMINRGLVDYGVYGLAVGD